MVRLTYLTSLFCLGILLPFGLAGQTQQPPSQIDPALAKLAARIVEPLRKAKAKKVVVVDLRAPGLQAHPVGKWLADQLSAALQEGFPEFEVMDGSQLKAGASEDQAPANPRAANERDMNRTSSLGADILITGTFGKASQVVGVSLWALRTSRNSRAAGSATGAIPISEEISALFPDPIPSAESNGAFKPGVAGIGFPVCSYCPTPQFSDAARRAHYQGVVTLQIVVTAGGRAENIRVIQGPGMGLAESAIRAIRDWRFKPAVDWDGNPVAVVSPVEVTFRLLRDRP